MTKFARLEGISVRETMVADVLPPFHPSLDWRQCPDVVTEGYTYNEGADVWTEPAPPPPRVPVPPADDVVMRAILIDKGVFSQAEWDAKQAALKT